MSVLFEKLKNLFSNNGLSLSTKKQSALPACIKTNVEPELHWNIAEQIGDGAFGQIFKAVNKETGVEAAVKRVVIADAADIGDYVVEIEILSICNHANIVKLLDSYYYGNQISIYLEYCAGGAVDSIMHELERPLSELQISCVARQLCLALEYVHALGIIHRDLKAGNVLLKADGVTKLGITLIELAEIDPPNHTMNPSRVLMKIRLSDPPFLKAPTKWSEDFNDFIRKCLQKEPSNRLTAAQLLQHSFVVGHPENTQPLAELVAEVRAEVTIQVTDVDSVDLVDAVYYDTQSSDGVMFYEVVSSEQDTHNSESLPGDKPMEALHSFLEANDEFSKDSTVRNNVDGSQKIVPRRQIQELKLKFDIEDDDKYSNTSQYIFANARRLPKTPGYNGVVEENLPVVSEVNSNFSRQKVRYQSLTKTRRYVYGGEIVTRRTSKVIVSGMENVEQEEREMRKAELRALQLLQRAENRQREEFDERMSLQRHHLERQLEQRRQEFVKSYSAQLEVLDREHRQRLKKLETVFNRNRHEVTEQLKVEQERDLKTYRQEMKLRQDSDVTRLRGRQKEVSWDSLEQLESEYVTKEQKFIEQQQTFYKKKMQQCSAKHHSDVIAEQLSLLNKKQQLLRRQEAALWEVEERYLLESGALKKQQIQQLYELLRRQLAFRRTQEMELVRRSNERGTAALQRRLAADRKQLNKRLKREYRVQRQAFCDELQQRRNGAITDKERDSLRQFDEVEKQKMKESQRDAEKQQAQRVKRMRDRNAAAINDIDQQFLNRQQVMIEKEGMLLQDEEAKQDDDLRSLRESLDLRLKQLESELSHQRNTLDLSSIQLADVSDSKYQQAVTSELRHAPSIFVDEKSTSF